MSSVLETLSLPELINRKENLLKQLQKVEFQIENVKKNYIHIPKKNTKQINILKNESTNIVNFDILEINGDENKESLFSEKIAKENKESLFSEKIAKENTESLFSEKIAKENTESLFSEKIMKENTESLFSEKIMKENTESLLSEKIMKEKSESLCSSTDISKKIINDADNNNNIKTFKIKINIKKK